MSGYRDEGALSLPADLLGQTERHAVYRCYSDLGELLYVGTSGQLGRRLADHAQKVWFLQVRGITLEWYADELEARNAERRAIHVEHPKYNIQGRNAKPRRDAGSRRRRSAPLTGVAVMRAFWDRETAAGRIPSGADLLREAGLSQRSSLGRQKAAQWSRERNAAGQDGVGA